MARLRDVPHVFRSVGPIRFVKRVWKQGSEDQLMGWAAALAYSWLFAVFPFFIFLMTLIPLIPIEKKKTISTELHGLVHWLPKEAADTLWSNIGPKLEEVLNGPTGVTWIRVTGLVLALWSASSGMAATMNALDRCYELKTGRSWFRQRALAALLTVVIATLILMIVLLLPIGGIAKRWVISRNWYGFSETSPTIIAFDIARWALAGLLMLATLSVLYHWGPAIRQRFRALTPGAVFSLCVWVILGIAFKIYLAKFAQYNKTYGTVGGAAVLLLMFYVDAAVLLWGAELNSEIDFEVLKVKRGERNFIPAEDEQVREESTDTPSATSV
jgi:membrane protein